MDELAARQFVELERTHWWFEGRRRLFFDVLARELDGRAGSPPLATLDVGCGAGGMLGELARFGPPAGLEISRELLEVARGRGFSRLFIGSAERLPVRPGALDLVTAFDCMEHLDDDVGAMRAGFAALKPGGHLFVSVPAWQFLYAENDRVSMHKRRYTRGELVRKLRSVGFEIAKASYVNAWLFPLICPAVLLLKLKQRFFKRAGAAPETNLSFRPPRALNALLAAVFASERFVLRLGNFPIGHSIVALARRP
jgi:SAM-dependent methyltransferase